jgi:hypothetical protein
MTVKPATLVSATVPKRAVTSHETHFLERWSFVGMAVMMIATSIAGFAPAILNPGGRRGPISPLAAIHGVIFFAWLLVVVFESAIEGYFLTHYDFLAELENTTRLPPGPTGLQPLPDMLVRSAVPRSFQ